MRTILDYSSGDGFTTETGRALARPSALERWDLLGASETATLTSHPLGGYPLASLWGGKMKLKVLLLLLAVTIAVAAQTGAKKTAHSAANKAMPHNAYTPEDVKYGPAPPFVPKGAELSVLEGNPMGQTGDYTIRIKTPDGYQIAPHWHPKRENVTVIQGTLMLGMGDKFDESKMKTFPAGSFGYLDPSMHHYVKMKGETIVQIHGMAPVKFNYVNPSDDPSGKK
jgi:ChrR-like protein with cupin domain